MKYFAIAVAISMVKAQHLTDLQFIGDYVSEEEAKSRDFCETKYCLFDSQSLFLGATQNISIKPCEDFREFALGTFIKYKSVNDRDPYAGLLIDIQDIFYERLRKLLASAINANDSRVIKGIKSLYAKCVSSDYVNRNGVREIREYLKSYGLNFFPYSDQNDFNSSKYFEQEPDHAINTLLQIALVRFKDPSAPDGILRIKPFVQENVVQRYSSYKDMLYDMNHIYSNGSYLEELKKQFSEIADKQFEFYKLLVS